MTTPSEHPTSPLILWIDFETTGLNVEQCAALECAALLTSFDGREEIARGEWVVNPEEEFQAANLLGGYWEEEARAMHVHSGLYDESMLSKDSYLLINRGIRYMLEHNAFSGGSKTVYLGGSSVHFDVRVLKKLWALESGGPWPFHYRLLDMSAVSTFFHACGFGDLYRKRTTPKAHRAMADVLATYSQFQTLRHDVRANFPLSASDNR